MWPAPSLLITKGFFLLNSQCINERGKSKWGENCISGLKRQYFWPAPFPFKEGRLMIEIILTFTQKKRNKSRIQLLSIWKLIYP